MQITAEALIALLSIFGMVAMVTLGIVALVFNRSLVMSLKGLLRTQRHQTELDQPGAHPGTLKN